MNQSNIELNSFRPLGIRSDFKISSQSKAIEIVHKLGLNTFKASKIILNNSKGGTFYNIGSPLIQTDLEFNRCKALQYLFE